MNYYCAPLAPDDLNWELRVVREFLRKEPDRAEWRARLAELHRMSASPQTVDEKHG